MFLSHKCNFSAGFYRNTELYKILFVVVVVFFSFLFRPQRVACNLEMQSFEVRILTIAK